MSAVYHVSCAFYTFVMIEKLRGADFVLPWSR